MQTALYGKIKERKGAWLIEHTKLTLPFNYSNTTQDKTKARKALRHTGAY